MSFLQLLLIVYPSILQQINIAHLTMKEANIHPCGMFSSTDFMPFLESAIQTAMLMYMYICITNFEFPD